MAISDIFRYANHSDHEHEARVNGVHAGYDHANYVDAYGETWETTLPDRFADVADIWHEAYQEGKDDYTSTQEEEGMYGHDWRA